MDEKLKENILAGRSFVDEYRGEHTKLYDRGWHKGIPEEHTPLLNSLKNKLNAKSFDSIEDFFAASDELNAIELGFNSFEDFNSRASDEDQEALDRMWH